jgi:HJR/Mrr/RecB family endonuclease
LTLGDRERGITLADEVLFVWRATGEWSEGEPDILIVESADENVLEGIRCPYCGETQVEVRGRSHHYTYTLQGCGYCGWGVRGEYFEDEELSTSRQMENILRDFEVSSAEVTFSELGAFLKTNYESVYSLSPRRFELLVGDVFKNQGFQVEVTRSSKDGGYDLILLNDSSYQTIVEVKCYKQRVGVELVRQLRGVQLRENAKSAVLVTASSFTRGAVLEAKAATPNEYGFELQLIDANDILKLLDVYTDKTFSLVDVEQMRNKFRDRIKNMRNGDMRNGDRSI